MLKTKLFNLGLMRFCAFFYNKPVKASTELAHMLVIFFTVYFKKKLQKQNFELNGSGEELLSWISTTRQTLKLFMPEIMKKMNMKELD